MKTLSTLIFVLFSTITFGQQIIQWNGGTPGRQTEWNEPRNWMPNKVPNEFSHVVIKKLNNGHSSMPVIDEEVFIESLEIVGDASLSIRDSGALTFDGMHFLQGNSTLTSEMMAGYSRLGYGDLASEKNPDSDNTVIRLNNTPF